MRIACICSPKGSQYRIYRTTKNFENHLNQLVPILLESRFKAMIGGMDDEPDVVMTVGPLNGALDAEFREQVMQHLGVVPTCVSGVRPNA